MVPELIHNHCFSVFIKAHERQSPPLVIDGLETPIYRIPKTRKRDHEVQFEKADRCFILEMPTSVLDEILKEVSLLPVLQPLHVERSRHPFVPRGHYSHVGL
ncbi:unnamed protein product [Gadus morhua 'NCC']